MRITLLGFALAMLIAGTSVEAQTRTDPMEHGRTATVHHGMKLHRHNLHRVKRRHHKLHKMHKFMHRHRSSRHHTTGH